MNAYDEIPYPSYTHPQTHPDRLATIARLYGLQPATPARCRVLELGAGNGSNLIPMACMFPQSEFIGIDLAERPIADGLKQINELGLQNIRLESRDLTTVSTDWGRFDYIIAHGVYSWVPAEVREGLLRACRSTLSDQGVAYVSYNAFPGGHARAMLREMMRYHVQALGDTDERINQARALAGFIASGTVGKDEFRELLRAEAGRLQKAGRSQLFHDDLAETNKPFYFTEFVHSAAAHGLIYLGEADYFEMVTDTLPAETRRALDQLAGDRVRQDQYLDFLKCRRFRQTLLCHKERSIRAQADPDIVADLLVATSLESRDQPVPLGEGISARFQNSKGATVETDFMLGKAALAYLIERAPDVVSVRTVVELGLKRLSAGGAVVPGYEEALRSLSTFLLNLYGSGALSLHTIRPQFAAIASDKPRASALSRWQVRNNQTLTTAFHNVVEIEDELGRHLISLLDGTRDHEALAAEMFRFLQGRKALNSGEGSEQELRRKVRADLERNLTALARLGLLEG